MLKKRHSHIWRIALTVINKHRCKSIFTLFTIITSISAALLPPLILEKMINTLSNKKEIALITALTYLIIFAISGIFESLQNVMITIIGQAVTHEIRSEMSRKLQKMKTEYFTNNETGKITSRFVNDVDAVDALFTNGIISMFADAFKILSILIVIFIKSPGLGIIMCVVTPILCVMTYVFQKRMRRAQIRNRVAVAKVNNHVPETIKNIRMIRSFSCEKFMEEKYDSYIRDGFDAMNESNFYDAIYSPIIICISSMIIAVMMVCSSGGMWLMKLFGMSVGSAVAVIAYVNRVFEPLESIGMEIQNIQSALAGTARIDEYLNEEEKVNYKIFEDNIKLMNNELKKKNLELREKNIEPDGKNPELSGKNPELSEKNIEFDNVVFGYENGIPIIKGKSFSIAKGEYVVFAGRTGAGKTTIFKLILGLYEPWKGSVKINGEETVRLKTGMRRKIYGYVSQHFNMVEGTIRDQIALFEDDINDSQINNVLTKCGLIDKVMEMPKGLDTKMSLSEFSQGELQLLSIARALVSEPEIMLLDEITANLDSFTEQKILDIIQKETLERTVISISHRLAEKSENVRIINV